jgi:hypothetical protein
LKDGFQGNYERETIKNDYFIFQKKVVVDNLISTNGGNVLIVADELVLNAPIDTRVYMRMLPNYWAPAPAGRDGDQVSSLGYAVQEWGVTDALQAFDSLYLWRDVYDPAKKMYVYSVVKRPSNRPQIGLEPTELPQLPSGQVPVASAQEYDHRYDSRRPTNGANAPVEDVIWPAIRSGTIRIYASKISLCDECKKALYLKQVLNRLGESRIADKAKQSNANFGITYPGAPNIPLGDPYDVNEAIFLRVSGLKGGRGGAGSMYNSMMGNLAKMAGGLSGLPGRAGDAGSIEIHYVNGNPTTEEKALLKMASSVEGGLPAQSHQQRTPSLAQIRGMPNRNVFRDEVPVQKLAELNGAAGELLIDSLATDAAILAVYGRLVEAEVAGNYSIGLLVGAKGVPDLFSVSPIAILQTFIAQELVRRQHELLTSIEKKVDSTALAPLAFSPFFSSLSCIPSSFSLLPDRQQEHIAKLCEFRPLAERDPIASYLFRVGGIYRDVPSVNFGLWHQQIVTEVNRTQKLVFEAINEIKGVRLLVYDAITQEQRTKLVDAISRLQQAKQALDDAYEAAIAKQPTLGGDVVKSVTVGKDFADAIAAIYGSNWIIVGTKFESGIRGLSELLAYRVSPQSPSYVQIDTSIREAEKTLRDFVTLVQSTKTGIVEAQGANLKELIVTRQRLDDYRTTSRFNFDKLLRATLQEYIQTSDLSTLRKNIQVIRLTIDEENFSSILELPSLRHLCQGNPAVPISQIARKPGCVEFDRKSSYVVMSKNRFADWPLLIVSKADGTITHSLEEAFQAEDLQNLSVSFEQLTSALPIHWKLDCSDAAKVNRWQIIVRESDGRLSSPISFPPMYFSQTISSLAYIYAVGEDGMPAVFGTNDNFDDQLFRQDDKMVMFKKVDLRRDAVGGKDSWILDLSCN